MSHFALRNCSKVTSSLRLDSAELAHNELDTIDEDAIKN